KPYSVQIVRKSFNHPGFEGIRIDCRILDLPVFHLKPDGYLAPWEFPRDFMLKRDLSSIEPFPGSEIFRPAFYFLFLPVIQLPFLYRKAIHLSKGLAESVLQIINGQIRKIRSQIRHSGPY